MSYPSIPAGRGYSTVYADMDFETYSEAGYVFNTDLNKWRPTVNSPPYGWKSVGTPAYAEHPSTEILCLAYNLKQGAGRKLWIPGLQPPEDLFEYIRSGGLVEAHNSAFEWYIWNWVAVLKMGWRVGLPHTQLRCSAAKSRAFSCPGALKNAGEALDAPIKKGADGDRLIKKFSVPRQPTKHDPRRRIRPEDDPADAARLYAYCLGDIAAESSISALLPDLSPTELEYWLLDQTINFRGVHIDRDALGDFKQIIKLATVRYTDELRALTDDQVQTVSELDKLKAWLKSNHTGRASFESLDAENVIALLKRGDVQGVTRRALELRQLLGSASVKKVHSLDRITTQDGRVHDLFMWCGADRTGRTSGRAAQPQNLPNSGIDLRRCICGRLRGGSVEACACGESRAYNNPEWSLEAVEAVIEVAKDQSLGSLEARFGDALGAISGCLRGLFSARPGHDLLCSDFEAIEAVILAELAQELWRIEVFRTHGRIYEASASRTFNVSLAEILEHKEKTGEHHPLRKKGKIEELASGYGGGLGAWRAFGAEGTDAEIQAQVKAWRAASPNIVNFWYRIEDAATYAIRNAGRIFSHNGISYGYKDDILYCLLPSGRSLTYHQPRILPGTTPWGAPTDQLSYMGWNTDYKKGKRGWIRLETWGGKLTENIVQAVARDLLFYSMLNIERAGYPVVLQIHDEIVSEVPEGYGSVEEYESIMSHVPDWARGWSVRAAGGWRGKRYRK